MSTEAWKRAWDSGARAIEELQLGGVGLREWLQPCSKGDCEALGIIWPEHPHDRYQEINDSQVELFTERWAKAVLRAAFPILAAWHDAQVAAYEADELSVMAGFHEGCARSLRARIEQMKEITE